MRCARSRGRRHAARREAGERGTRGPAPFRSRRVAPPSAEGRWSLLAERVPVPASDTQWSTAMAQQLLARYGVVTREVAAAEGHRRRVRRRLRRAEGARRRRARPARILRRRRGDAVRAAAGARAAALAARDARRARDARPRRHRPGQSVRHDARSGPPAPGYGEAELPSDGPRRRRGPSARWSCSSTARSRPTSRAADGRSTVYLPEDEPARSTIGTRAGARARRDWRATSIAADCSLARDQRPRTGGASARAVPDRGRLQSVGDGLPDAPPPPRLRRDVGAG